MRVMLPYALTRLFTFAAMRYANMFYATCDATVRVLRAMILYV